MVKRNTNKSLIAELLPIMKKYECFNPKLSDIDYYKHPYHKKQITYAISVRWTQYGKDVCLDVCKLLPFGKYDRATIQKWSYMKEGYGYAKEFRGCGHGFYADLDLNGKIVKSEWD